MLTYRSTNTYHILVVDDDPQSCILIRDACKTYGWQVSIAHTCAEAMHLLGRFHIDALVLDRVLPDGDGAAYIKDMRDISSKTRILLLSQKSSSDHRIFGLRKGADEYLSKPYAMEELLLRIQKLLNMRRKTQNQLEHIGAVTIRDEEYACHYEGRVLPLAKKEFELFRFLLEHHDMIVQKSILAKCVWLAERYPSSSAIEACIKRVRRTLVGTSMSIKTKYRVGYMLVLQTR